MRPIYGLLLVLIVSLLATAVSIRHITPSTDSDALVAAGANYTPKTVQSERERLLRYAFIVESEAQAVVFGSTLFTSGFVLIAAFGVMGWLTAILSILLSVGAVFALFGGTFSPTYLHSGPFELTIGLTVAAFLTVFTQSFYASPRRMLLSKLAVALCAAGSVFLSLSHYNIDLEAFGRAALIFTSALAAGGTTYTLIILQRHTGPFWERSILSAVAMLAVVITTGFALYFAPRGYDHFAWKANVKAVRAQLYSDLRITMAPDARLEKALDSEFEIALAKRFEASATALDQLVADAGKEEDTTELKLLSRLMKALDRLHQARAIVLSGHMRTQTAFMQAADPANSDPLYDFWRAQRPWLDAELTALRYSGPEHSEDFRHFTAALDRDLDRLTQAALKVEVRRVDLWVGWASRRPASEFSTIRNIAVEQAARLEAVSNIARERSIPLDPRMALLDRDLRRIAHN